MKNKSKKVESKKPLNKGDVKQSLPIEKAWDWNSRVVPEDGYSIEELNWVIGEDVMLKEDFVRCVRKLLNDLYKEIKHGDKAHQKWLKDKVRSFSMGNVA